MGVDLVGVEWLLHLRAGARGRPRTSSAPSADRSGTPSRNQGLAGATEEALQDPNRHMREFVGARAGDWSAKKWRGVVGGQHQRGAATAGVLAAYLDLPIYGCGQPNKCDST